jgi:8-oxo-dGTP diphosphatase
MLPFFQLPTVLGCLMMTLFHNMNSHPFIPLATERLLMRPIRLTDASEMGRLLNNWNVSRTTELIPYPYTVDDATEYISLKLQDMNTASKSTLILSITDRQSNQLLGVIGYENDTIGYWLGEPFWGKGYMTEASKAFVHFLFDTGKITGLEVSVIPSNVRSVQIIEKLGFIPTIQKEFFSTAQQTKLMAQHYQLTSHDFWMQQQKQSVPIVWVSAAALFHDGKLLMAERPVGKSLAGLWELPGGKIEVGETPEKALVRELHEELGIDVLEYHLQPVTFASYRYEKFHLFMPLYAITQWQGRIQAKEKQRLAWINYNEVSHYPTPAADINLLHKLYDAVKEEKLWI